MSVSLLALLNAVAQEEARIQAAAQAIVTAAPFTQIGLLEVQTPTPLDTIDAVSVVTDPQGYGLGSFPTASIWSATPGAPASMSPSGLPLPATNVGPTGWANFVRANGPSAALSCSPTYVFPGASEGGGSWSTADPFGESGGCGTLLISGSTLYAGGFNGDSSQTIAYSTDGGATWSYPSVDPFAGGECAALAVSGSTLYAGGFNGDSSQTIAYSTDGGATWSYLVSDPFGGGGLSACYALAISDLTLYAGGDNGDASATIAYSTDGGATWSYPSVDPFAGGYCSAIVVSGSIYAVGVNVDNSHTFAYSTDGGATWSYPSVDPFAGGYGNCSAIVSDSIYAGGFNGDSSQTIAYSTDGGATWSYPSVDPFAGGQCEGLAVSGSVVFAAGDNAASTHTFAYSQDAGESWSYAGNEPLGATGGAFGYTVAVSGSTIFVGGSSSLSGNPGAYTVAYLNFADIAGSNSTAYCYLYVRCTREVQVQLVGASSETVYDSQELAPGGSWRLVALSGSLPLSSEFGGDWEPEALQVASSFSGGSANDYVDMTAVTLCDNDQGFYSDPGGPFSGDIPDDTNYAYRWAANPVPHTAAGCFSNRYTCFYDLLAIAEAQADISLAPLDLSELTRQIYLVERFQARHQPSAGAPPGVFTPAQYGLDYDDDDWFPTSWVTGFIQQIGDLIRTQDPTYDDVHTNVQISAPWRSFTVSIYYAPSPAIVTRLVELIETFSPYHLNAGGYPFFQVLSYGTFIAGISMAGDSL